VAGIKAPGLPLRWVAAFYAALLAAALAWRGFADGAWPWRADAPAALELPLAGRLLLGAALGLAIARVARAVSLRSRAGRALLRELGALLGPISAGRAWLLALASGVAEEAFFRGALQPRVGWLFASVIFGAAHFVPRPGLRSWALFALLAGFALGALFDATGDLAAPAAAHVVVNGVNLAWLGRRARAGSTCGPSSFSDPS
jgi:hypothetical protein